MPKPNLVAAFSLTNWTASPPWNRALKPWASDRNLLSKPCSGVSFTSAQTHPSDGKWSDLSKLCSFINKSSKWHQFQCDSRVTEPAGANSLKDSGNSNFYRQLILTQQLKPSDSQLYFSYRILFYISSVPLPLRASLAFGKQVLVICSHCSVINFTTTENTRNFSVPSHKCFFGC